MTGTQQVAVEKIVPNPRNPRENFNDEKIDELAESIDEKGLLQAVLVRPVGDGFELVHGERRLRAVESLNHDTIKAEVRDLDDGEALEVAITENLQREDVTPIAEARAYQQLIDEFDITQGEAADRLGVSQSKISNQLRLLSLPEVVQRHILHKIISPWQGRVIGSVWDRWNLLDLALDHDLSVNQLREVKQQLENGDEVVTVSDRWDVDRLEGLVGERDLDFPLDGGGVDAEAFAEKEQTHAVAWAKDHLDAFSGFEGVNEGLYETCGDIRVSLPAGTIPYGETRVEWAVEHGYEGEMAVTLSMPEPVLRRPTQPVRADGGETR